MNFEKLYWIRGIDEPHTRRPILVGIKNQNMHWNAGFTRCGWQPEKYTIVKEYPANQVERATKELAEEYAPKPQPPTARLGLISPEGHFYPCGYCCHHELRNMLCELFYDNYTDLRNKGWISLVGSAYIDAKKELVSQESINTFERIVEEFELAESENPNINWHDILLENPEGYAEQIWFTSPTDSLTDTYATQLRDVFESWFGDYKAPLNRELISKRIGEHTGD